MDLFFEALNRSVFGNVERRDSGPAHLDKTSDEYYAAAASDVTDDRVDANDSMFGVAS